MKISAARPDPLPTCCQPMQRQDKTTKPFRKVTRSFQKVTRSDLKVTRPFRLFPAKGRPCRRRDAATPPLSHLAFLVISLILACKLFWKQPEQLVKTTSSFSPRNLAAILKPGAVAPGWQELFLSVVMVVSFSTKLILIYIPAQARAAGLPITSDKITGFYRIDMIF